MNTDPLFDGIGECTADEIEDNFCLPFKVFFNNFSLFFSKKDLTFSEEVWDTNENDRLSELNDYIEDNYIFKKKFLLKKGY